MGTAVGPPLIWQTMSGSAAITSAAGTVVLPGIEVPPVCIMTTIPYFFAHLTMGAASFGLLIPPRPISPTTRTPSLASSSKSFSCRPGSRMRLPPRTFTPPGLALANDFAARMARAFVPATSFGLPGRWTSPAEIMVVTPPWRDDSM